jgi:hypothetical protein
VHYYLDCDNPRGNTLMKVVRDASGRRIQNVEVVGWERRRILLENLVRIIIEHHAPRVGVWIWGNHS